MEDKGPGIENIEQAYAGRILYRNRRMYVP